MDWAEFYNDEGFIAYRKQLVSVVAKHIYGLLTHISHKPEDAREIKGALDLAYKILEMPMASTKDSKQTAQYAEMLQQDLAGIAAGLVQRRFEG